MPLLLTSLLVEVAAALGLAVVDFLINGVGLQQLLMSAQAVDLAVVQHQDAVSILHRGDALCNDDLGGAGDLFPERLADLGVRGGIHGAGGVIEDQDLGFAQQGAGNGQALLLAAGDVAAALLDPGVVLIGEALDEFIGAGQLCHPDALFLAGVLVAPAQVIQDGAGEQHVLLQYHGDLMAEDIKVVIFHVHATDLDGAGLGVVQARNELDQADFALPVAETGTVKVGGVDVKDYNLDVLRHEVSMVLQKNVLFSGTILDNLRWGNENASEEECIRVAKLACADEFIERFPDQYNTWIEQGGSNVSGGQKQRLTIARALLRKPKVLILDDSTSAVDTATDAKIRKAFREEIPGTTKIIIAQRISSVQDADRILVLDNGQINGLGTHEELLKTNAIYQEVYNSQTQGSGDFDKQGGEQ